MRTAALLLLTAATAGAIGAVAMRPKCTTATPVATRRATTMMASVPEPLAIASFAMPVASVSRRNVFAFRGEPRQPIAIRDVTPPRSTIAATTVIETPQVVVEQRPPDYNYVGSFGPQSMPILVYKGKGDVVNVPLRKP